MIDKACSSIPNVEWSGIAKSKSIVLFVLAQVISVIFIEKEQHLEF